MLFAPFKRIFIELFPGIFYILKLVVFECLAHNNYKYVYTIISPITIMFILEADATTWYKQFLACYFNLVVKMLSIPANGTSIQCHLMINDSALLIMRLEGSLKGSRLKYYIIPIHVLSPRRSHF